MVSERGDDVQDVVIGITRWPGKVQGLSWEAERGEVGQNLGYIEDLQYTATRDPSASDAHTCRFGILGVRGTEVGSSTHVRRSNSGLSIVQFPHKRIRYSSKNGVRINS